MSAKKAVKKTIKKAADEIATNVAEESVTRDATSAMPLEMPASPTQDVGLKLASQPASDVASGTSNLPSRESVAALASRIIAAQITGIAHYETTASLWNQMLGVLATVVSSLEQNRDAKLTPEVFASALKSGLSQRRSIPRSEVLGPIGFAGLEPLTDSAIHYAENLLLPSLARYAAEGSIVFAEQLFGVDEILSENGILGRFKDFEWPKLCSPGSVRDLLKSLDEWFAEWIRMEHSEIGAPTMPPPPGEPKLKDSTILMRALKILQAMDHEPEGNSAFFSGAEDAIKAAIRKKTGFPVTKMPRGEMRDMDWDLIDYFYCGEAPSSRLANRRRGQEQKSSSKEKERKEKVSQINYRPWGLFRYLRLYAEGESARKQNAKLMIPREKLSTSKTPEALYNDLYGMHAIEQRVRRSEDY
jgi:hypothetical protein